METVAQGISKSPLTSILTLLAASRVGLPSLPKSPGSAHVIGAPYETIHDRLGSLWAHRSHRSLDRGLDILSWPQLFPF